MSKNSFLLNTLKLSSAPLITQILSFLLLPLITRLYSPYEFGIFNLYTSSVGVFAVFCGMGYHQALVLPKKNIDAFILFLATILLTVVLAFLLLFATYLVPEHIYKIFKISDLYDYRYYVFLGIFLHGLYVTFLGWHIRFSNFGLISLSRVLRVFSNKVFIILLGLASFAYAEILIIGEIIGTIFVCFLFIIYSDILKYFNFSFQVFRVESLKLMRSYKQFPLFSVSNDLLYRIKEALILILVTYFFSISVVGYYGIALMILSIPTTLLGSSISEVFYKRISIENDNNKIGLLSLRLFKILCFSSFYVFTFIAFFSLEILPSFLGEKWTEAGMLISIICLGTVVEFIFSPIINLLKILDKQQVLFYFQLLIILFSGISISIGGIFNDFYISFFLFSFITALITFLLGLYIFKLVNIRFKDIVIIISKNIFYLLPFIIIFYFLKIYKIESVYYLIPIGIICFVSNIILLYNFSKDFKIEFLIIFKKIPFFIFF